jgi:hypothetical protein
MPATRQNICIAPRLNGPPPQSTSSPAAAHATISSSSGVSSLPGRQTAGSRRSRSGSFALTPSLMSKARSPPLSCNWNRTLRRAPRPRNGPSRRLPPAGTVVIPAAASSDPYRTPPFARHRPSPAQRLTTYQAATRAEAVTSDRHGTRLAFQSVSVPAEYARPGIGLAAEVTECRLPSSGCSDSTGLGWAGGYAGVRRGACGPVCASDHQGVVERGTRTIEAGKMLAIKDRETRHPLAQGYRACKKDRARPGHATLTRSVSPTQRSRGRRG